MVPSEDDGVLTLALDRLGGWERMMVVVDHRLCETKACSRVESSQNRPGGMNVDADAVEPLGSDRDRIRRRDTLDL